MPLLLTLLTVSNVSEVFLSNRPLLDNAEDAARFVGRRTELELLGRAVQAESNVLLVGSPGMGRTTLLRHFEFLARAEPSQVGLDSPVWVRYVRAQGARTGGELLESILDQLGRHFQRGSDAMKLLNLLQRMRKELNSKGNLRAVIMLDDIDGAAGRELFGYLRDELWGTGFLWVLAVREIDRDLIVASPAEAFFEQRIVLRGLPKRDAEALLCDRAGVDLPLEITEMLGAGEDHYSPRSLVDGLRGLGNIDFTKREMRADVIGRARRERDRVLSELGRPAWMLFTEVENRGAVSASDESLQEIMGWSRPRLVQVFEQLATVGLVTSFESRAERGRPKRMFEVVDLLQFAKARLGGMPEDPDD